MNSGDSKLTCRPDSICCRWRSISSLAKAGRLATSERMRKPVSKLSFITTMLTKLRSVPAPAPSAAPMKSTVSCSSFADRPPAPCVSTDAASSARPFLPFGSSAPPARTIIRMLMTGCSWCSTATTCKPFGQRLQVVGRKLDVARRQRPRRVARRPARLSRDADGPTERQGQRQGHGRRRRTRTPTGRAVLLAIVTVFSVFDRRPSGPCAGHDHRPGAAPDFPGITVMTRRFSGVKNVRATRCTSAFVMFWKISNSPSAVAMLL